MLEKIPFCIAILGIVGGVLIAIGFGVNEEYFQNKIADGLSRNIEIQQMTDSAAKEIKLKSEGDKNWRYYQRFHFHATGIGALNLALLIFLSFISVSGPVKIVTAYATALGGFFYPFVWLFAGMFGPEMGRHAAKEAFAIFGYMGGVFLLGSLSILFLAIIKPVRLKLL